ncbi:hypothetical protein [Sediminicola sp. 1XM1-17]|uniref:hypothetical protein n=1 Tax=Sediminicola sp. 1XM1-17 TaxID=3127702 RepID=UPI0030776FAD
MGIIIKEKKHYLTRFPIGLFIIILIGLAPMIIGAIGLIMTDGFGHGGDNYWMAFHWYVYFTVPVAGILFLIYSLIIVIDTIALWLRN